MNIIQTLQTIPVPARQKSWTGVDFGSVERRLNGEQIIIDELPDAIDCQKIIIEPDSNIQYVIIQNDSIEQDSFRTRQFYLQQNAMLELITIILGGATSELIQEVYLEGAGAASLQRVVVIGNGEQKINLIANNIHAAPECHSDITVKTILSGSAISAFNGLIKIHKGAHQTNAYLRHDTYVLSETAKNITIPGLEIDANDVKASHSASQSKLKPEDLLYLTSRGLTAEEGRSLILEGFIMTVVEGIKNEELRIKTASALHTKLDLC
jgi:Fe-S cluster assembly protein SufD